MVKLPTDTDLNRLLELEGKKKERETIIVPTSLEIRVNELIW